MRKQSVWIGVLCVAVLALSGCRSTQEVLQIGEAGDRNPGPCPRAFALYDASRIVNFVNADERYDSVGLTGEIEAVRSLCRYFGKNPINADLEIEFALGRGPAAETQATGTYQYFVAVTRKNVAVINKKVFPLSVTFPEGSDRVRVTEKLDDIIIPRATDTTSGENFEIVVGFEVTPAQRAFNADGKRFRVSTGQTP